MIWDVILVIAFFIENLTFLKKQQYEFIKSLNLLPQWCKILSPYLVTVQIIGFEPRKLLEK